MSRGPRGGGRRRSPPPERERTVDLERYRSIVDDWRAFMAAATRPEPTVVRVCARGVSEPDVLERLAAQGFTVTALEGQPGFHRVEGGGRPVSRTLEHWQGRIYVQQASTGVAAPALGPRPGDRVLDVCSAPGGKTTHIAALMHDEGCLVASEISEPRIRGLLGNVYRLGCTNVLAVAGDGRAFPAGAEFDRVLLDAPCSGEGTLRRRAGRAPKQSRGFLGYVTGAQRALLERAVMLTKPGGTVLYVTCTFAPEENEAVVSDALARLPVELEPLDLAVPHQRGVTGFEGTRYDPRVVGAARIFPHHLDSGGLFLARLRKLDDGASGADAGWGPVPPLFAEDDEPSEEHSAAEARMRAARAEVVERYGVTRDLEALGWTMRGGRAWVHTVGEWPVEGWPPARWRAVSVGLRAIELDSKGRPRPTNDFLRWLGADVERIELDGDRLGALLAGAAVPTDRERRGPVVLGWRGEVVGRGAVTERGLVAEIPKARARDLARVMAPTMDAHDDGEALPDDD